MAVIWLLHKMQCFEGSFWALSCFPKHSFSAFVLKMHNLRNLLRSRQKCPKVAVTEAEGGSLLMFSSQCKQLIDLSNPHLHSWGKFQQSKFCWLVLQVPTSFLSLVSVPSSQVSFSRTCRKPGLLCIHIIEMYFEGSAQKGMSQCWG